MNQHVFQFLAFNAASMLFGLGALAIIGLVVIAWFYLRSVKLEPVTKFAGVITDSGISIEGEIDTMNVPSGKRVIGVARFKDSNGNPGAAVQAGTAVVEMQDGSIFSGSILPEEPDADGRLTELKVEFRSLGPIGATAATLRVDGDPSSGVAEVVISGALNAVAGNAATGEFVFGDPQD